MASARDTKESKGFDMNIQIASGYFTRPGKDSKNIFRPFTESDKKLWVDGQLYHHVETQGDFIKTMKVKKFFIVSRGDSVRYEEFPEQGDSVLEKLSIIIMKMALEQKRRQEKS